MTSRWVILAGALLLPVVAQAQPVQGLYINLDAGANFVGDLESSPQKGTKVYTGVGPVGLVDLGWGFGNGLRAEIEGSYRSNEVSGFSTRRNTGQLEPLGNPSGNAKTYALMANIEYDIPFHPFGLPLRPYVGAGLGYSWLDFGNGGGAGYTTIVEGNNSNTGPVAVSFGSAGAFAYQAMVGASLPLPTVLGLELTMEYRFFGTAKADVPVDRVSTDGDTINGATFSEQGHNGFILADQAILIGLRYSFGGGR